MVTFMYVSGVLRMAATGETHFLTLFLSGKMIKVLRRTSPKKIPR